MMDNQNKQIVSDDIEYLPLSYAQSQLWYLEQLYPETKAHNLPVALQIKGNLDIHSLEKALQVLINRHESLRTRIIGLNGVGYQVVDASAIVQMEITDLTTTPIKHQKNKVNKLIIEEASRSFNLTTGPLVRFKLYRLNQSAYTLLMLMHHIICDGWSIGILIKELGFIYQSFYSKKSMVLPPIESKYIDFVAWQQDRFTNEVLQKRLVYWERMLDGALPRISFPISQSRPLVPSGRSETFNLSISRSISSKLRELGKRNNATLFMVMAAASICFLARYSCQKDIVVGVPFANRTKKSYEKIVGLFTNVMPVRITLTDSSNFIELLLLIRKKIFEALINQEMPFEQLVKAVQPPRDLNHHPIFQVVLNHIDLTNSFFECEEIGIERSLVKNIGSKFDLTINLVEKENNLEVEFDYDTDLFDSLSIKGMASHFNVLLKSLLADPSQSINTLQFITEEEKSSFKRWNDTKSDYPAHQTLHEMFEEKVRQYPENVALVSDKEKISYRELNNRANCLAHFLQERYLNLHAHELPKDTLIGLCVERGIDAIVGMLGIMKFGAAYVPLDPGYPQERLRYMLEDSNVAFVVTQSNVAKKLSGLFNTLEKPLVFLDDEHIQHYSIENPMLINKSQDLAYVIYTSGSTGVPKGVMIEHAQVLHSTCARLIEYINQPTAFLFIQSISFDSSVAVIFWSLMSGARLIIANNEAIADPRALIRLSETHYISHLLCTPSLYEIILENDVTHLNMLSCVILAGEASTSYLVKKHYALLPDVKLVNEYGPTEACVWATYGEINPNETVTIGGPIRNAKVYVLDEFQRLVPIGMPGELYIGGSGIARGYLNKPELTEERFIRNPFHNDVLRFIYKTGDRVRWLSNGKLEYLGRLDDQVKIRGFRIELGEVETVLNAYSAINQSIVVIQGEGELKRLVAYLVLSHSELNISTLRNYLSHRLPHYMIPTIFVPLHEVPLNANGKIDKKNLPPTDNVFAHSDFVEPKTDTEKKLSLIWKNILDIKSISNTANFFELGGHSLLILKMAAQIDEIINVRISLRDIFENPTLQELSLLLDEKTLIDERITWEPLMSFSQELTSPVLYLVPAAGMSSAAYLSLADILKERINLKILEYRGLDGLSDPHTNIDEIVRCYLLSIKSAQPKGPYFLAGHSFGGIIAFEIAKALEEEGSKVKLLMLDSLFCFKDYKKKDIGKKQFDFLQEILLNKDEVLSVQQDCNQFKKNNDTKKSLINSIVNVYNIQINLSISYIPSKILASDTVLFYAEDGFIREHKLENVLGTYKQWIKGSVDYFSVKGTHLTMFRKECVASVANKILNFLQMDV